jgi:hypothetical protein
LMIVATKVRVAIATIRPRWNDSSGRRLLRSQVLRFAWSRRPQLETAAASITRSLIVHFRLNVSLRCWTHPFRGHLSKSNPNTDQRRRGILCGEGGHRPPSLFALGLAIGSAKSWLIGATVASGDVERATGTTARRLDQSTPTIVKVSKGRLSPAASPTVA